MIKLQWAAVNAGMAAALYLGLVGHEWAWRIAAFMIVFESVMTLIAGAATADDDERERLNASLRRSVGPVVQLAFDVPFALILVATGHWILGTLYTLSACVEHGLRRRARDDSEGSKE